MNKKLILKLITHMNDYVNMCCDQGYSSEEIEEIIFDLNKLENYLEQNKTIS